MTKRRKPWSYTDEFKQQLVQLYHNGKPKCDICRKYDIATSLLDKWLKQSAASGSFHEKNNRSAEDQEYETLEQLQYELSDYVNWFNNHRIHSSLGYMPLKEYRLTNIK